MGGWRAEWENRRYETHLSPSLAVWPRVPFLTDHGTVRCFAVQYEAVFEGTTYPVIRWDTAHGYVHRDTLDWEGRVTEAIVDVRTHWSTYHEAFAARKPR